MQLQQLKHVYFIGIGGIGMSAIARYMKRRGIQVSGYDKTATVLTKELEQEGMSVHYEDRPAAIPQDIDLVVYTPAIPKDMKELEQVLSGTVPVMKRSEALQWITAQSKVAAVAGTHGKTTTSTLLAHLMKTAGADPTAFLGGISANYNSNSLLGNNDWMVVEADEYDRSFLRLAPYAAIITAADPDHLDIYKGGIQDFEDTFCAFSEVVKKDGVLLYKKGIRIEERLQHPHLRSYSITDTTADWSAHSIQIVDGTYHFDVWNREQSYGTFTLTIHGRYNVENALATIALCLEVGLELEKVREGISSFRGVKRRFEYVEKGENVIYIDDYAHHPNEIEPFLNSVRELYPTKHITAIFQPHLFSRTRDFLPGFRSALSLCDELILLPIYPARELPIPGIVSELILEHCTSPKKAVMPMEEVIAYLSKQDVEVLCTIGAGDIDLLIEPLKQWAKNRNLA
jgi:UDP-N-acetylmuramate--alanine ligase